VTTSRERPASRRPNARLPASLQQKEDFLRIALLSYRAHPHVGGQGVYVSYLARALKRLGHSVEVFAGPPYPEAPGVPLTPVPSLDLYRPDDPFRRPRASEFRDEIDVLEYAAMCAAGFPEPLTFSLRVARILRSRAGEFDVVHDNQSLGYGLLRLHARLPVVATVHHPITIDRRLALGHAPDGRERRRLKRWYAFTRMQGRVARRLDSLITVSRAAQDDVVREFQVERERVAIVHNGVDPELFRPLERIAKVPGRLVCVTNAGLPMKGLAFLVEALAKLRTEREAHLVVVAKVGDSKRVFAEARRFGVERHVEVHESIDALHLVELFASAEVAVVPSLYEGFSLPAVEAMSCAVPLVSTTGGALPEVVGADEEAALHVAPGDAAALANAVGRLLDDPALRRRMGAAGRKRVLERFTWETSAAETVAVYDRARGC
jgi:glycosyltransferase involved in cell wall biosynthesis